ncbi:MAG TPA: DUF5615 family PIN-like protein [Armatimonadota bacterium]|jgi:hypothetical protein
MRFKVDNNLSTEVVDLLRSLGHDAERAHEEGLSSAPDDRLLAAAVAEGRVLITLDVGFGDIRVYPPSTTAGIIVLRPPYEDIPVILALVMRLANLLPTESPDGHLWVVDEHRVRIHE